MATSSYCELGQSLPTCYYPCFYNYHLLTGKSAPALRNFLLHIKRQPPSLHIVNCHHQPHCVYCTVLCQEEGYTMKYCMKYMKAQVIFHRKRLQSQYSHSQLPLLANIFSYWLHLLAIFSRIGFVSWPNTGPYTA